MIHKIITLTEREIDTIVSSLVSRQTLMRDGIFDKNQAREKTDYKIEEHDVISGLLEKVDKTGRIFIELKNPKGSVKDVPK